MPGTVLLQLLREGSGTPPGFLLRRPFYAVFAGVLLSMPMDQAGDVYAPSRKDPRAMDEGGLYMKMLKPGDPCPCCGEPIPEGLDWETMLLLSYIAETTERRGIEENG